VAVSTAARVRNRHGEKVPAVALAHPGLPFQSHEVAASVFAIEIADGVALPDDELAALHTGRRGKRFTPASDALHDSLRPLLKALLREDDAYDDAILAFGSAQQAKAAGEYQHGGWAGAFTWRRQYDQADFEQQVWTARREALLAAGAFGGDGHAADTAFQAFSTRASQARSERY
jgi:hypothetical protein